MVMFAEFRNGNRASNDAHFFACQSGGLPMITINVRRTLCDLEWDAVTMNDDDHLRGDAALPVMRVMYDMFCTAATGVAPKSLFDGSAFVGSIKNLPLPIARQLADQFFEVMRVKSYLDGVRAIR
jgi:hypothetical protein